MSFKLAINNVRKSFKDYSIYFITLMFGVAIFYMFNALDSQEAMLVISESTRVMVTLIIDILNVISVFVAIILGFLIVYASNFLIKRRKKEFGVYMILGMGKRKIAKILLFETILIGILSLIVGLILGFFGSQLMSVIVSKLFESDMSRFEFVFSKIGAIKTIVYFGIMYILVAIFNVFVVSKYKLIDLLIAIKKNEEIKIKNTLVSSLVFVISILMLSYAYHTVTINFLEIKTFKTILNLIILGSVGTFLLFWSLSGFVLKLMQSNKKLYLKGTNMFVLRQIYSKINTTVMSMTIICLMLFVTITALSSSITINNSMKKYSTKKLPVDVNLEIYDSLKSFQELLQEDLNFDLNKLKDITEVSLYKSNELLIKTTLSSLALKELELNQPHAPTEMQELIMKISDYNKIAKLYGLEELSLSDQEYLIVCDFEPMKKFRDLSLSEGTEININGITYTPKYDETKYGFVYLSPNDENIGIIIVPDSANFDNDKVIQMDFLAANYNGNTREENQKIEDLLFDKINGIYALNEEHININTFTKISILDSNIGVRVLVIFISIYLGIIFLMSSAAILALKELSESSDNKERYMILRKIGVDEKMINRSLLMQIGIFFSIPLTIACIHSFFGIQFGVNVFSNVIDMNSLAIPILITAIFIVLIYGTYFIATYFGSKRIIREN
jgi:ABC-type transport system, involved in lipoprotein release, permease component